MQMTFSTFANILYPHCGEGNIKSEFVKLLIDKIMEKPITEEELEKSFNDNYNPIASLAPNTLNRIYRGTDLISKKNISIIRGQLDKSIFATYINEKPLDVQFEIAESMKNHIDDFKDDDIGESCAEVFSKILKDMHDESTLSSKPMTKTKINKKPLAEVPTSTVHYNPCDNKIHIGEKAICLPKELIPSVHITPEEDIYTNALVDAYCDTKKGNLIKKYDLTTLPKEYEHDFKEQRKNYFSADYIQRSVREIFADGENQFDILKNDTYDYISDTHELDYKNAYARLKAVLIKSVDSYSTSVLSSMHNLISPKTKKGICHMLVNDRRLTWVMDDE